MISLSYLGVLLFCQTKFHHPSKQEQRILYLPLLGNLLCNKSRVHRLISFAGKVPIYFLRTTSPQLQPCRQLPIFTTLFGITAHWTPPEIQTRSVLGPMVPMDGGALVERSQRAFPQLGNV